ncbi:SEA (Seh1-associated) complex subunit [Agyrium rufum]|nr:SEA (Seh1-associated) complex subunit [Agyrium rufum]
MAGAKRTTGLYNSNQNYKTSPGTHRAKTQIAALDISPYRSHAVLAGREVLKTIRIDGVSCTEEVDLRASIISQRRASKEANAHSREQISANDVKWSHGQRDNIIATAASSGRVILYDLLRNGAEVARFHEHPRQVHRLAFNPHHENWLLSGSQDGTIRFWDLRNRDNVGSTHCFSGNSEGIRDVRWSPADGFTFAVGTDSGAIQRWDTRRPNAPVVKINAHDANCTAIDWHPAGRYLASAGYDKNVKIWDFQSSDRRMKPMVQFRAPQSVTNVRWRYPSGASLDNDVGNAAKCTQVATTYTSSDPRIHVWDLRRPHVFSQEIDRYETPASDILWHSEELLWSVGAAGMFTQSDMEHASLPNEQVFRTTFDAASNNEIAVFAEIRPQERWPMDEPVDFGRGIGTGANSGEKLGTSKPQRNSFEEPYHLGKSIRIHRQTSVGIRSSDGTPPSQLDENIAKRIDETFRPEGHYDISRLATHGSILGVFDHENFEYLARTYMEPLDQKDLRTESELHGWLRRAFDHNTKEASVAGEFRTSRTWQLLGQVIERELLTRAREAREARLQRDAQPSTPPIATQDLMMASPLSRKARLATPRPAPGLIASADGSSQMPTPIARPTLLSKVPSSVILSPTPIKAGEVTASKHLNWHVGQTASSASPQFSMDDFQIGVIGSSYKGQSSPEMSSASQPPSPEMIREADRRRLALADYRALPRPILRLDSPQAGHKQVFPPPLDRHESNESFQMFSTSMGSSVQALSLRGSYNDSQQSSSSDLTSERWDRPPILGSPPSPEVARSAYLRAPHLRPNPLNEDVSEEATSEFKVNPPELGDDHMQPSRTISNKDLGAVARPGNSMRAIIHPVSPFSPSTLPGKIHVNNALSIIPTDFYPNSRLLATPPPSPPWSLEALLPSIIDYHLNALCDPQLPAFLILYLYETFPHILPSLSRITAIVQSYHQSLSTLGLYLQSAQLRHHVHEVWPENELFAVSREQSDLSFKSQVLWCNTCDTQLQTALDPISARCGHCTRCHIRQDVCAICMEFDTDTDVQTLNLTREPSSVLESSSQTGTLLHSLWRFCSKCSHGGHTTCLETWWVSGSNQGLQPDNAAPIRQDYGSGGCPWEGCTCDCVPGSRRNNISMKREREKRRGRFSKNEDTHDGKSSLSGFTSGARVESPGNIPQGRSLDGVGVLGDGWVVDESRAVEGVRGALGDDVSAQGYRGGGTSRRRGRGRDDDPRQNEGRRSHSAGQRRGKR